jgi:oligopeptide/dipeptide ABC transporter ATP-binding protein
MRQRVMIAMALAGEPALLIADEPTTALDVTIQARVLDLLTHLCESRGMSLLLITHDLGVVARVAHRTYVMYAGRIVEEAPTRELLESPAHPYTAALLECVPRLDRRVERLPAISGSVPPLSAMPGGCRFHPRCGPGAGDARCAAEDQPLVALETGRAVACWKRSEARG